MIADQWLDQRLEGMRLISARTGEYVGPCPHCRAGRDRYHIWTQPGANGRPAGRYWCRACGASGLLVDEQADREHDRALDQKRIGVRPHDTPVPGHILQYRQLYELTALWAHGWLLDESNPEPLQFLARRGLTHEVAKRYMLGYALHDEQALVAFLTEHAPELLPYAKEAGLLVLDRQGLVRTHWNLCGALIFPTLAEGAVTDLRARSLRAGAKTKSLAGAPFDRGAIYPFGWDEMDGADTVILTESGEFKTLVPLAAYHDGLLSAPTIGIPGINGLPPDLGSRLRAKGVHCVIIAYDSQPRPLRDGVSVLAPEEIWTLKHGRLLAEAGLEVRVIRLPLSAAERAQPSPKSDLDLFYLEHGARQLQQLLDEAPLLDVYAASLPRALLRAANLSPPNPYPTHRARPRPTPSQLAPTPASPASLSSNVTHRVILHSEDRRSCMTRRRQYCTISGLSPRFHLSFRLSALVVFAGRSYGWQENHPDGYS
jgi:DNA primase catalytic core, N-terminal domain